MGVKLSLSHWQKKNIEGVWEQDTEDNMIYEGRSDGRLEKTA
jgi:hypothetical protein